MRWHGEAEKGIDLDMTLSSTCMCFAMVAGPCKTLYSWLIPCLWLPLVDPTAGFGGSWFRPGQGRVVCLGMSWWPEWQNGSGSDQWMGWTSSAGSLVDVTIRAMMLGFGPDHSTSCCICLRLPGLSRHKDKWLTSWDLKWTASQWTPLPFLGNCVSTTRTVLVLQHVYGNIKCVPESRHTFCIFVTQWFQWMPSFVQG